MKQTVERGGLASTDVDAVSALAQWPAVRCGGAPLQLQGCTVKRGYRGLGLPVHGYYLGEFLHALGAIPARRFQTSARGYKTRKSKEYEGETTPEIQSAGGL